MHLQLKPCTLHIKLTHLYNDVPVIFSIQQHYLFNLTKNRLFYFANTSHYNKDSEKQLVKDVSLKEHGLENLLSQEIMSESRTPLEDTGHNIIIYGRVFKTADVLTDFHESQPYAMIVRITSTTRKVIEPNPNLKVIVRHDADFDVLDVKTYPDNNIQVLHEPAANSTSIAEAAI